MTRATRYGLSVLALVACAAPSRAREAASFAGKTVTLVIGFEPGGPYDLYGRLVARALGARLPGQPKVVVQNMPGAGGLIAANWLYNVAPRDGTQIAVVSQTAGIGQVLDTPGVKYDVRKFAWIGRVSSNVQILNSWRTSAGKTMDDALRVEIVVAGTGPTSSSVVFPRLMNDLLGAKFRVVPGYQGVTSATLAMERGEVDAVVRPWADIKSKNMDWVREGKINLLVQFALRRHADLPAVPAIVDLARDAEQRALLGLFASGNDVGNAVVAPPDTPPAVVEALRRGFDEAMKDPALVEEAARARMETDAMPGRELQQLTQSVFDVTPAVIEKAKIYNNP